jgi:hypothetical protein
VTREEALAIATMMIEAYPREVKPETLKAYALHLADLDRGAAGRAVKALVATSKWLPTIAEVRACVARASLPAAPSVGEAWAEAMGLMASIGSYGAPGSRGNPYVNRTLRLCGRWADVCQEDTAWLRKRFVDLYADVVTRAEEAVQVTGALPAWLEDQRRPALAGGRPELEAPRG